MNQKFRASQRSSGGNRPQIYRYLPLGFLRVVTDLKNNQGLQVQINHMIMEREKVSKEELHLFERISPLTTIA